MNRTGIVNHRRAFFLSTFWLMASLLFVSAEADCGPKDPMPLRGSFSLVDETGKKVTLEGYRGRYLLIYFGYTYCPDICPTSLGIIGEVLDKLSPPALDKLTPLFVTVDPERDTVEHVNEYTDAFHPKLIGLTGSVEETNRAAKTFGVYFAKAEEDPDDPTDYLVDHSSNTFFLDPQGRIVTIFGHAPEVEEVVRNLEQHLVGEK
ncbi:MAG: SCO family protein [Magnetococcales bacterium]|nr:SCO family protein [Magnetococcales bacterium]